MDFNNYCKTCGHHIEFQYGEVTGYCPICDKKISRKETIAGYTLDARMSQLKAMHDLLCECNDESIYMRWINIMPDTPSETDFKDLAIDDDDYNECWDAFLKLVKQNGMRW